MNNAKITIDLTDACKRLGIDVTCSPLSEAWFEEISRALGSTLTTAFLTRCLHLAAKKQPATRKRKTSKEASTDQPVTKSTP